MLLPQLLQLLHKVLTCSNFKSECALCGVYGIEVLTHGASLSPDSWWQPCLLDVLAHSWSIGIMLLSSAYSIFNSLTCLLPKRLLPTAYVEIILPTSNRCNFRHWRYRRRWRRHRSRGRLRCRRWCSFRGTK